MTELAVKYTDTVNYFADDTLFRDGFITFSANRQAPVKSAPFHPIYDRAARDFSQDYYQYPTPPVHLGEFALTLPAEPVYALRLLIRAPRDDLFHLPARLEFLQDYIATFAAYQAAHFPDAAGRFVYLTVRSGPVLSSRDDEMHVDGFQGISVPRHIPEQNYLWASSHATLYSLQPYWVSDLDPAVYNLHSYLERATDRSRLMATKAGSTYLIDPYHVHARPRLPAGITRTVVRLTFSPVEIRDDSNTVNPRLPRGPYNREDVRNTLRDDYSPQSALNGQN